MVGRHCQKHGLDLISAGRGRMTAVIIGAHLNRPITRSHLNIVRLPGFMKEFCSFLPCFPMSV